MYAYVGCYTTPDRKGRGQGISVYQMDAETGVWKHAHRFTGIDNPSFLALDSGQRFLYCVHGGNNFSAVSAFAIDRPTGALTYVNTQDCGGPNPVALTVHPSDRWLVVANYANGTAAALPINPDGSLAPRSDLATQSGPPGPHPTEQTTSHPHHIPFDPTGRYLGVPDKGLDRVYLYRLDTEQGRLIPPDPPYATVQPGAGPRHMAFHPHLPFAYVINELDSTLGVYAYDGERGTLDERQMLSTLPEGYDGQSTTSEIAIAPSGRFLYGSNRGHDSIVIFAIDQATGTLTRVGWEPTQGKTPRFFALDPSGRFLYSANQDSDTIVTFRVDGGTGTLTLTGQIVKTGCPVCIVFVTD